MTTAAGELRRLVRQSPIDASCGRGGRLRPASALLAAVLGFARLLNLAHGAWSSAEQNWPQWFHASPAVVGKDLFLRGHDHLYCIAEK